MLQRICYFSKHFQAGLPPLSDAIDRLFSDLDEQKAIMDHIRGTDAVAKIEAILNEECQEVKNDGPEKDRAA